MRFTLAVGDHRYEWKPKTADMWYWEDGVELTVNSQAQYASRVGADPSLRGYRFILPFTEKLYDISLSAGYDAP